MLKRLCIAIAAAALVSCTASKPPPSPPASEARTFPLNTPQRVPAAPGVPPAGAQAAGWPALGTYRIDSSQSELRLLVYRAGALASLGHNHVIVNRSVNGTIEVGPSWAASSFTLSAAVAAFIIDDSQARAEEGEDFAGDVSDGAKSGTWNNMTGPALLDAVHYPVISVHSVRLELLQGVPTATMIVSIAGHDSSILEPLVMHVEKYGLAASASFDLSQTAVGLTPFSLMLGALAVRDTMRVKLKLIAELETPGFRTPVQINRPQ
jgi:hypothetical protein